LYSRKNLNKRKNRKTGEHIRIIPRYLSTINNKQNIIQSQNDFVPNTKYTIHSTTVNQENVL